jgi:hypothetical protein
MLSKPTEGVVRALLLMKHPEFAELVAWIRASHQATIERIAEMDIGPVTPRLQGEARQLKELLTHIEDAQNIALRMNQK